MRTQYSQNLVTAPKSSRCLQPFRPHAHWVGGGTLF